jgi:hypothetical protein
MCFGALDGIPGLFPARLHRRQAVDLLGVEDGGKEHPGPLQPNIRFHRLALGVEDRLAASSVLACSSLNFQYWIGVPFSPLRTCAPAAAACL